MELFGYFLILVIIMIGIYVVDTVVGITTTKSYHPIRFHKSIQQSNFVLDIDHEDEDEERTEELELQ